MDDKTLTGNFNAHLSNKLLVVANELGNMGAAHRASNKLKSMIIDDRQLRERKGVDVVVAHDVSLTIINSNHDQPVLLDRGQRRNVIAAADNALANQKEYFAPLAKVLKDPRVQVKFFREMQERSLPVGKLGQHLPSTAHGDELIKASAPPVHRFLAWVVGENEGCLTVPTPETPRDEVGGEVNNTQVVSLPSGVMASHLLWARKRWMVSHHEPHVQYYSAKQMAFDLKRLGIDKGRAGRGQVYHLPAAAQLHAMLSHQHEHREQLSAEAVEAVKEQWRKRKAADDDDEPTPKLWRRQEGDAFDALRAGAWAARPERGKPTERTSPPFEPCTEECAAHPACKIESYWYCTQHTRPAKDAAKK